MTTGYCMKCKQNREMKNPITGKTKRGVPMTRGACSTCGTNICRLGK